ncbi:hypothetical protein BX600DRAFT_320562 [Xylariales sp. PMI_506]|nr:hypothetical protein BX600DRAFT_320562 [Xylariales sp. PMI_506]
MIADGESGKEKSKEIREISTTARMGYRWWYALCKMDLSNLLPSRALVSSFPLYAASLFPCRTYARSEGLKKRLTYICLGFTCPSHLSHSKLPVTKTRAMAIGVGRLSWASPNPTVGFECVDVLLVLTSELRYTARFITRFTVAARSCDHLWRREMRLPYWTPKATRIGNRKQMVCAW